MADSGYDKGQATLALARRNAQSLGEPVSCGAEGGDDLNWRGDYSKIETTKVTEATVPSEPVKGEPDEYGWHPHECMF